MSSGAAVRARQLLAANESDSIESIKDRIRSPGNVPANQAKAHPSRRRRRSVGQIQTSHETTHQLSSRAEEILSSMRRKRESFRSIVQESKSPGGHSTPLTTEAPPTQPPHSGKPPRISKSSEKEEIIKKIKESLQGKKQRLSNLANSESSSHLGVSRSPHTVDTASTTEESASSSNSWNAGSKAATPSPLSIPEALQKTIPFRTDSSTEKKGVPPEDTEHSTEHFVPIGCNGSETDHSSSKETTGESSSPSPETSTSAQQVGKKVSFDVSPPAVVHCKSFESTLSKDRKSKQKGPRKKGKLDDGGKSLAGGKVFSWDTINLDETQERSVRYSSLVNDRDKRVSLMQKLQQTYNEVLNLHQACEDKGKLPSPPSDDSDCSFEAMDDESSCELTNDTNTSGWISQDDTNSKLDSLIQYMTSEEDGSGGLNFSFTLSKSASNLDTLPENDAVGGESDATTSPQKHWDNRESARDKEPVLPTSPLSLASTIIGSDVVEPLNDSADSQSPADNEEYAENPLLISTLRNTRKIPRKVAKDAPATNRSIESFFSYARCESPLSPISRSPSDNDANMGEDPQESLSRKEEPGKNDPMGQIVETDDAISAVENSKQAIRRDPTEEDMMEAGNGTNAVARDPSVDAQENSKKTSKKDKKDPTGGENASKQVGRDPSMDALDESKKEPCECDCVIDVIKTTKTISKGIVRRAIDRLEAAKDPKRPDPPMLELVQTNGLHDDIEPPSDENSKEPMPVESPLVSVEESPFAETPNEKTEMARKAAMDQVPRVVEVPTDITETKLPVSKSATPRAQKENAEQQKVEEIVPTQARKKIRKFLFVPRKLANQQCMALGGLFDLAKKTGISDSSTLYVKSRYIPRPPSMIAINAELDCGTQGSLYNLAVRSGCHIDPMPEAKEPNWLLMTGNKKRWMLKTRGGHHHITVWTTLSNSAREDDPNPE